MSTSSDSRQIAALLRISQSLDIVGDVSVTVAHPSELLAWASSLSSPSIFAWRGHVSGKRFVHITSVHGSNPVHGRITAALRADEHPDFWKAVLPDGDLDPGEELTLSVQDLAQAWEAMPIELPQPPAS
jgi:hypothetical protein